jgi:hypothetical protein
MQVTLLNLEGVVLGELKFLETGETLTDLGEVSLSFDLCQRGLSLI